MRILYSLVWWLALPFVLVRLLLRSRQEPGYRQHWRERLGFYGNHKIKNRQLAGSTHSAIPANPIIPATPATIPSARLIWVHAVSVGETRAAQPLIEALLNDNPACQILLTHMTPGGRKAGQALFMHQSRIQQCYLPYDTRCMTRRFLRYFKPDAGILMETEIWPNLLAQCAHLRVPMALVNARLSARSFEKGRRFASLLSTATASLTCVAAQTEEDADRLRQSGARSVHITGNVKFDVDPPTDAIHAGARLRQQTGNRLILLCASTRDGEETLILDALASVDLGNTLIILVPRHSQRFDKVAHMIEARNLKMCRRSTLATTPVAADIKILLGDSMGEMFTYYAACDLAFIGGSLLPLGGQNLIEACALGKPVLIGPHTFNFEAASKQAIEAGAAIRIADAASMLQTAASLLLPAADEERQQRGQQAQAFALQHRGATARTLTLLQPFFAH